MSNCTELRCHYCAGSGRNEVGSACEICEGSGFIEVEDTDEPDAADRLMQVQLAGKEEPLPFTEE